MIRLSGIIVMMCITASAIAQIPPEEYPTVREDLNNIFSNLYKTKVPTASTLAINYNGTPNESDYTRDYFTNPPTPEIETPFDSYFLSEVSSEHISIDNSIYQWISNQISSYIEGPDTLMSESAVYSANGYETGLPSENFTVTFRNIIYTPSDSALALAQKYLKGTNCYLAYSTSLGTVHMPGTKNGVQLQWRYTFLQDTMFLTTLEEVIDNATAGRLESGEMTDLGLFICNHNKQIMQALPFVILYNPE